MSRIPVLVINAAEHSFMSHVGRSLVPLREVQPYLLTHPYGGVDGVDPRQYPNIAVCNFHDPEEILAAGRWMIREFDIEAVVSPHEKYVTLAAELRSEFELAGLQRDTALLFRDKLKMKQKLHEAGVRVPAFKALDSIDDLGSYDWSEGSKIIKSRFGVGGAEVYHVNSLDSAYNAWRDTDGNPGQFEIEEYIEGAMYHLDAAVNDGEVIFCSVSKYIAKPGDFSSGGIFGSVTIQSGSLLENMKDFNERAIKTLGMQAGVTHLELFHTSADDLVFCEVAARPGGAGIDRVIDQRFGVNMIEAAVRLEAGLDMPIPSDTKAKEGGPVWGFVGIYPDGPEPGPAIEEPDFDALGIKEYTPGSARVKPRHCSDFTHRYIITAADEEEFRKKYQTIAQRS